MVSVVLFYFPFFPSTLPNDGRDLFIQCSYFFLHVKRKKYENDSSGVASFLFFFWGGEAFFKGQKVIGFDHFVQENTYFLLISQKVLGQTEGQDKILGGICPPHPPGAATVET